MAQNGEKRVNILKQKFLGLVHNLKRTDKGMSQVIYSYVVQEIKFANAKLGRQKVREEKLGRGQEISLSP